MRNVTSTRSCFSGFIRAGLKYLDLSVLTEGEGFENRARLTAGRASAGGIAEQSELMRKPPFGCMEPEMELFVLELDY